MPTIKIGEARNHFKANMEERRRKAERESRRAQLGLARAELFAPSSTKEGGKEGGEEGWRQGTMLVPPALPPAPKMGGGRVGRPRTSERRSERNSAGGDGEVGKGSKNEKGSKGASSKGGGPI